MWRIDRSPARGSAGSVAWVASVGEVGEVGQDLPAVLGRDGLGMELNAPARQVTVAHAHDHAVFRPRGRHQNVGQRFFDTQRVVPDPGELRWDAGEQVITVMRYL